MKKLFLIILLTSISFTSCITTYFIMEWIYYVNLDKVKNNFEKIENVKVIKVWHDDIDHDSAGALILINEKNLIMFQDITNEKLIDEYDKKTGKKRRGGIAISRIDDWGIASYSYRYGSTYKIATGEPVKSIAMGSSISILGEDSFCYRIFNIKNNSIEDVINNFEKIKAAIEELPENIATVSAWTTPAADYWDSKANLFQINEEERIGKVRLGKINLDSLNDEQNFYFYH